MSTHVIKFCWLVVRELFGPLAGDVVRVLLRGPAPLDLIRVPGIPKSKVKSILVSLLHHNLVTWELDESVIRYSFDVSAAVALVRVPRYLQVIRDLYSANAETIVEEIVNCGRVTLSQTLFRVGCRICADDPAKLSLDVLKKEFYLLRDAGFLQRCPAVVDPEDYLKNPRELAPKVVTCSSDPVINLSLLEERIMASEKDEGDQPDRTCFWKVNVKRFDVQLRDMLVSEAATRRTDELGGALIRSMLLQLAQSPSSYGNTLAGDYSFFVLKSDVLKLGLKILAERMRDYLEVLQSGALKLVRKIGESGGGQYAVAMKDAIDTLTSHAVRSIVRERHGTKAARVFTLLLDKRFVDQEQIQEAALIPAKEAKVITYLLLENHFVTVRELRKSMGAGTAAMKSVYLFSVDLPSVVRGLVDKCYKSLGNIISRKDIEVSDHDHLLRKKADMDSLLKTLVDQGAPREHIEEIACSLTPPEAEIVARLNYVLDRLSSAELEVDSTLLLFEWYLFFDGVVRKERVASRGRGRGRRVRGAMPAQ